MDLKELERAGQSGRGRKLPPVEKWNPPSCGDIGMHIRADGLWYYQGTPIGRERLVRLFSTILRRDEDGIHYLVTPVEKVPVKVDDAPFLAVSMKREGKGRGQILTFRTNVGDETTASADHPMRFALHPETQEPRPYVHVRAALEARITRALFYDLVELGAEETRGNVRFFGIWSAKRFFPITEAEKMRA